MTKVCYIMVGVSGSGKSTVVDQLVNKHQDVRVFSLDTVRIDMFSYMQQTEKIDDKILYEMAFRFANENTKEFDAYVNTMWQNALKHQTIIVDNTNLTRKSRTRWIQEARKKGFMIVVVNVMTPLSVVLERQASRSDKKVPENVVRDMYMRLQEVQSDEYDMLLHYDGVRGGNMYGTIKP